MNMANMFGGAERKNSQHLRFEEFVPSSGWTEDSDGYCLIVDLPGFRRDQVKLQVDNNGHIVASGERQVNEYKRIRFEQYYKMPENSDIEDTTVKFEDEILYIVIPKKIKADLDPQHEITNIPEAIQEEKETRLNAVDKFPEAVEEAKESKLTAVDKVPEAVSEEEVKGKDQYTDATASSRQENESDSDNHSSEETSDDNDEEEEDESTEEEVHDAKMEKQRKESSLVEKIGKELKKNKGILITAVIAFSFVVLVSQKFQANENNATS